MVSNTSSMSSLKSENYVEDVIYLYDIKCENGSIRILDVRETLVVRIISK